MNKNTILIVEDEILVLQLLRDNLDFEGYEVLTAETLHAAGKLLIGKPDLVLLDVNLPDGDGINELEKWRKNGLVSPVIVCTIKDREIDVIRALDSGADDYVTKPFRMRELLARIKAVLRRVVKNQSEKSGLGECEVDFTARRLICKDEEINLTATEWIFLEYLHANRNCVLTRNQIIEHVWGVKDLEDSRAVDVHLGRLRRKIRDSDPPQIIVTVRGLGYKLVF